LDNYTLDPLADDLTAREGTNGRVFLVLNDEDAFDIAKDPKGRDAAALLALAWKVGAVDLSKWESARVVAEFRHDCERCEFLGRVEHDGRRGDVWLDTHNGRGETVLIVRYSSEGSDYSAMPAQFYAGDTGIRGKAYALWLSETDAGYAGEKCPHHDLRTCYCP
jgi:hypothetical protein